MSVGVEMGSIDSHPVNSGSVSSKRQMHDVWRRHKAQCVKRTDYKGEEVSRGHAP